MKRTYIITPHGPPPERERVSLFNLHELGYRERISFLRAYGPEHYQFIRDENEIYRSNLKGSK